MALIDKITNRFSDSQKTVLSSDFAERWVILVVGCHYSGKTTITWGPTYPEGVGMVREITPSEMGDVERLVNECLENQWRVLLEFIFCDDPRALVQRAVSRATAAEKAGRKDLIHTIPETSKSFIEVPQATLDVYERVRDKVAFLSVDNSKSMLEMRFEAQQGCPEIVAAIAQAQWDHVLSILGFSTI